MPSDPNLLDTSGVQPCCTGPAVSCGGWRVEVSVLLLTADELLHVEASVHGGVELRIGSFYLFRIILSSCLLAVIVGLDLSSGHARRFDLRRGVYVPVLAIIQSIDARRYRIDAFLVFAVKLMVVALRERGFGTRLVSYSMIYCFARDGGGLLGADMGVSFLRTLISVDYGRFI